MAMVGPSARGHDRWVSDARPRRIQLRRTKGWRKPPDAVVVSRPSRWGNPFPIRHPQERAESVRRYRVWVLERFDPDTIRSELGGRDLACWCPLEDADGRPVPCHADVLLELANPSSAQPGREQPAREGPRRGALGSRRRR